MKKWSAQINQNFLKRIVLVLGAIVIYLLLAYAVGTLFQLGGNHYETALYLGLLGKGGWITLAGFCLMVLLFAGLLKRNTTRNEVVVYDENGVGYLKNKTRDSAMWMAKKDIPKVFYVGDIRDTDATVYGQLTEHGEKVVAWKKKESGSEGTRNDLVIATMGAGKTYAYVKNELLQTIARGDSFIASDPKYELFTDLALYAKEQGYDVHVLNMDRPEYSEFWNCLKETINPKTERLDGTRLNEFTTIYMQNSAGGAKDFWYESAVNLVKAVIGFVAWKRESEVIDGFCDLYKKLAGVSENDPVIDRMRNTLCSFVWCREVILKKAKEKGADLQEVQDLLKEIQFNIPVTGFDIGTVVDSLLNFNSIREEMEMIPLWHPASFSYRMYQTNDTETVRKSALQGAQMKFMIFNDFVLKDVLSNDGIDLSQVNRRKSAYFVILSDKTDTNKPIVSLFFSFFFKDVMDNYDEMEQLAKEDHQANPCLGVTAMLEEFFSIGVIAGSPEAFGKIMSTCRARKIYIKVIIQYYKQLEELYGQNIKDAIQGGCSTLLYLGANDPSTLEFISRFAGNATVVSESHREPSGRLKSGASYESNLAETQRPLVTASEARLWKDHILVIKQGEYPLKVRPFPWTEHPAVLAGKIRPVSIYHYIEPVSWRMEEIRTRRAENANREKEIRDRIRMLDTGAPEIKEPEHEAVQNAEVPKQPGSGKRQPLKRRQTKTRSRLLDQEERKDEPGKGSF